MRRILAALVVVGLLAAGVILVARVRLEARYRTVEIVLDGDDWTMLVRREGRDPAEVFRALRERGAVSVALSDRTLKTMADEGLISYAGGAALLATGRITSLAGPLGRPQVAAALRPDAVYATGPAEHLEFIAGRFDALLGDGRVRRLTGALEILGTQQDLEETGLGFRPADAAPFRAAGLEIVLRPRNYRGLSGKSLDMLIESYAAVSPEPTVIFALAEVQGYEGLIDAAGAAYRRAGGRFGRIEVFSARRKQRGEDRLTEVMRPSVIRVFSVTSEELLVLRPGEVADRFVRAAQERNLRLLYVRPLLTTPAGEPALETNIRLVETIASRLRGFGFTPARSRPLPPMETPRPLVWISALGALALVALVADHFGAAAGLPISPRLLAGVVGVAVIGCIGLSLTSLDPLWRRMVALAVAVAGAAGATVWALPRPGRPGSPVLAGWGTLLRALALSMMAGLFVAALLSQWSFMLAFSTFLGVKAAHIVPVVLVGVWLALAARPRSGWQDTVRDITAWFDRPLRVGTLAGVLVVGAAAVLLLARTGNISLPLSGVEQRLREVLENLLVARPRTKEFLLGYPALVLAGLAAARGWRPAAVALAMAGTIGTAGAINSFSHLHTPLLYTFWRTGNALLVGALLAIPAAVVLLWIAHRIARS